MRNQLVALRQREATLRKSARQIIDQAEKEGRDLSAAELANQTKTLKALDDLHRQILAEEAKLAGVAEEEMYIDDNMIAAAAAGASLGVTLPENPFTRSNRGRVGQVKYADLFGKPAKSPWKSFGEFSRAVANANKLFDPRLQMAATEGSPSGGGFLVPPEQTSQIFDQVLEQEIVRPRAQNWPMASETRKIPAILDDTHAGDVLFSGMGAGWESELSDLDEASLEVQLLQLSAHKFGLLNYSSNELLEDSAYEGIMSAKFIAGCAWHLDRAFLFGDGTDRPLGFLNAANGSLITVDKQSWQAADTFVFENACDMYSAMAPSCTNRAIWLFTTSLVPQLLKMQNVVTNKAGTENVGGSAVPVVTVAPDGSMSLLGRPIIVTEKLAAKGDLGDCCFVCLDQYAVGTRRDVRLESSQHYAFKSDQTAFRLTVRIDGEPLWRSEQTLVNGDVVSPFVQLQAR